jgi:hypothetical protein
MYIFSILRAKAREARKEARRATIIASAEGSEVPGGPSMERVTSHMSTSSYISIEEQKVLDDEKPKKEKVYIYISIYIHIYIYIYIYIYI